MAATKTKTLTVTFLEVRIRGYELRTIGANKAECIATLNEALKTDGFGECLDNWAAENPAEVEGFASPLEAWMEYAGAFCAEMKSGEVTYP